MYPTDRLYSRDHEWIRIEGDIGILGITHFAQDELGEIVFVDLPEVGDGYGAGDEIGSIESVKAVAEVYAPVTGEVVEVNGGLDAQPELINSDPHGEGWLVKLKLAGDPDTDDLMDAGEYRAFVEEEN